MLIAVVLACLALSPGTPVSSWKSDETPLLQPLDVCHPSSGGMSFDLPYLLCCPATQLPLQFFGIQQFQDTAAKPILLVFQDERPPQSLL